LSVFLRSGAFVFVQFWLIIFSCIFWTGGLCHSGISTGRRSQHQPLQHATTLSVPQIIIIIVIEKFNVAYVTRLLLGPQKHAQCETSHTESEKKTNVKSVGPDSGCERRNRKVFKRCLKAGNDGTEVMSSGSSSFQMLAPATGNVGCTLDELQA